MPLQLVDDPGYARLFVGPLGRREDPEIVRAVMRDRAVLLATMHGQPVEIPGPSKFATREVLFPVGQMVRLSPEGWLFWARAAARLGLLSHLPLWARVGLAAARAFERVAGLFR